MTDISPTQHPEEENELLRSRRKKMQRLEELGIDPWGHRFDDRSLIADIRSRSNEIGYCLESGQVLGLPDLSTPELKDQFREWIADQGRERCRGRPFALLGGSCFRGIRVS